MPIAATLFALCPAVLAFLAAYVFKPSPLCWSSSIKYVKP
jgi:hypothetical protein